MSESLRSVWSALAAPFAFDDLKIMPQSTSRDMSKALAVAYFDARAVMNRLDDVLTPAGWKAEYREMVVGEKARGIICRLTIMVDGVEVVREDGSDPSDIEGFKGAISGALKRAFAALGNRSLYDTDLGWQPIETYESGNGGKKFKGWTAAALQDMQRRYNKQTGTFAASKVEAVAPVHQPAQPAASQSAKKERVAFGYSPERWPAQSAFNEGRSVNQTGMGHSKAKERGVSEDEYAALRLTVIEEFGLKYEDKKAHAILWIDFLINASEETLSAARQATNERLGQGALL